MDGSINGQSLKTSKKMWLFQSDFQLSKQNLFYSSIPALLLIFTYSFFAFALKMDYHLQCPFSFIGKSLSAAITTSGHSIQISLVQVLQITSLSCSSLMVWVRKSSGAKDNHFVNIIIYHYHIIDNVII